MNLDPSLDMQLKITQKNRSLSVDLNDKFKFDLCFQENLWNNDWKVRHASGREFASIKKRSIKFFSSNAIFRIIPSEYTAAEPETLLLRYENRKPHMVFEHNGKGFQIVFHAHNRFSYFQGDEQIARTELRAHFSEGFRYESLFNEQLIDAQIFLLSQLGLIHLNSILDSDLGGFSVVTFRSFFQGELRPFDEGWG